MTATSFPSKQINNSTINCSTVLINKHLKVSQVNLFTNANFSTVKIYTSESYIILSNVYIPPHQLNDSHYDTIMNLFSHQEYCDNQIPIILTGDLNARHKYWHDHDQNSHGIVLFDLINILELTIMNDNNPTCFSHNGSSHIDLTIANSFALNSISEWHSAKLNSISDHAAVLFDIQLLHDNFSTNLRYTTWKFNEINANWIKYQQSVEQHSLLVDLPNLPLRCIPDIDNGIKTITSILIQSARDVLKPNLKPSKTNFKSPWWSNELENLKNTCNYRRNCYLRCKNPTAKIHIKASYYRIKYKYIKLMKKQKYNSWRLFLEEPDNNNIWGNTYHILKKNINNLSTNDLPIIDNHLGCKKRAIDSLLTSLFPDAKPTNDVNSYATYQTNCTTQSTFTLTELNYYIQNLNVKKAPGPDYVSNNMIKAASTHIHLFLFRLFRSCLSLHYFPKSWRRAYVTILIKPKRDSSLPSSYRPICLTSNLSKLFEKLINLKLQEKITLNPNQFGFKRCKSTVDALMNITNTAIQFKQQKCFSAIVAIDLKAAFDNAYWPSIIRNLHRLNLPSDLIHLVSSYLSDRVVYTSYDNTQRSKHINKGCPQGGVISPTLWNILVDELLDNHTINNDSTHTIAFADDLTIILKANSIANLNSDILRCLSFIENWCSKNQLLINYDKTNIVNLNRQKLDDILFNNKTIKIVNSSKILGVSFGNHLYRNKLNFETHINEIISKAVKIKNHLFNLIHNTWGLDSKRRLLLYKGMIRPMLSYASEVWFPHLSKHQINKLDQTQYNILLRLTKLYKYTSYSITHILADVPKLSDFLQTKQQAFLIKTNNWPHKYTFDNYSFTYFCPHVTFTNSHSPSFDFHVMFCISVNDPFKGAAFQILNSQNMIIEQAKFKFPVLTSNESIAAHILLDAFSKLPFPNTKCLISTPHTKIFMQLKFPSKVNSNTLEIQNYITLHNVHLYILQTRNPEIEHLSHQASKSSKRLDAFYIDNNFLSHFTNSANKKLVSSYFKDTNSNFQSFFVNKEIPKFFINNFYSNQIITNSGSFNHYLHKLKISPTENCNCTLGGVQDGTHLVTICSNFLPLHRLDSPSQYLSSKKNFNHLISISQTIYVNK